jgi:tRNA(Ile)-lysidine synthase
VAASNGHARGVAIEGGGFTWGLEIDTSELLLRAVEACFARYGVQSSQCVLALSGGIDSMVLLDVLFRCNARNTAPSLPFQAIHVNHGISNNANEWAEFCTEECAKRGVPITVEVVNVDRQSGAGLEAAARGARYQALMKSDAKFILTAQHQTDQAETVLHQMLRGTGLQGLAGMGEVRELRPGQILLRPLLNVSREDIEKYAKENKLKWIEDESNDDTTYTRNFIRHEIVPVIAERFPHYADSLKRIARHAHESAELNEALAKIDLKWDGKDAFADALDSLPLPRQINALYYWLRWQKVSPPSHDQLEAWASQLFRAPPEGKPHLAGGHDYVIRRKRNVLTCEKREDEKADSS